jgi:hypothetical protein
MKNVSTSDDAFDDKTLAQLGIAVEKTWDALPRERKVASTKEEIARLVILIAMSGVLDPDEITRAILAEDERPDIDSY